MVAAKGNPLAGPDALHRTMTEKILSALRVAKNTPDAGGDLGDALLAVSKAFGAIPDNVVDPRKTREFAQAQEAILTALNIDRDWDSLADAVGACSVAFNQWHDSLSLSPAEERFVGSVPLTTFGGSTRAALIAAADEDDAPPANLGRSTTTPAASVLGDHQRAASLMQQREAARHQYVMQKWAAQDDRVAWSKLLNAQRESSGELAHNGFPRLLSQLNAIVAAGKAGSTLAEKEQLVREVHDALRGRRQSPYHNY